MKSLIGQKLLLHAGNFSSSQQRQQQQQSGAQDRPNAPSAEVTVLACSAANGLRMSPTHSQIFNSRRLCEDRKTPLEHLLPSRFAKSTVKLTMMQTAHVISGYMNDQLKEDEERDELVEKRLMTRLQADQEAAEWAEREWKKRWDAFPKQLAVSFAKFHAVMLVTRFYEHVAERWVTQITLDKLTMDTFECAKRTSSRQGKRGPELGREMLGTCWNANLISFLADYSVHQVILLFGYYVYMNENRRQRRQRQHQLQLRSNNGEEKDASDESEEDGDDEDTMKSGPLVLSAVRKSTLLAISRAVGLSFTAVGGAVGSIMWPGWGTLAGSNLGDSLAATLTEDLATAPVV